MLKTVSIATAISALTIGSVATFTQAAIDPATLIAVGAQAAPQVISGAKSVLSEVYKARSVVLEVDNRTDIPLQAVSTSQKRGAFHHPPHGQIPPGHYSVFTSRSTGIATGTEGNVTYAGDGFNLVVYWKNPYIGSNKCWTNLSGPNAASYQVFSACGGGNKGAHMRYELSRR